MNTSSYEAKVIQLLKKDHITFEREKTFDDLAHGRFRYDFYVPSRNALIEVDGEQHYHVIRKFHKTPLDYRKAKSHDFQKNSYALAHGIKLYRIPYDKIDSLRDSQSLFQDQFLVRSRYD